MAVPGAAGRRPARGPLGGLDPGVGPTAARPSLVQELGDLRELVHGVGLALRELLLVGGPLPHVHQDPQPPQLPLPHRQSGEVPGQGMTGTERGGTPGLAGALRRGHPLRECHDGVEPAFLTH